MQNGWYVFAGDSSRQPRFRACERYGTSRPVFTIFSSGLDKCCFVGVQLYQSMTQPTRYAGSLSVNLAVPATKHATELQRLIYHCTRQKGCPFLNRPLKLCQYAPHRVTMLLPLLTVVLLPSKSCHDARPDFLLNQ